MDATLAATNKRSALYSYKGYQSYQPFNVWCYEMNMLLHTEFRDGNVPAGYEQLRMLEESLKLLPGMDDNLELPFPTMDMCNKKYKVTALVTNLEWEGEEIVHWYRQRCGKSEEVHSIMKEDLKDEIGSISDYQYTGTDSERKW